MIRQRYRFFVPLRSRDCAEAKFFDCIQLWLAKAFLAENGVFTLEQTLPMDDETVLSVAKSKGFYFPHLEFWGGNPEDKEEEGADWCEDCEMCVTESSGDDSLQQAINMMQEFLRLHAPEKSFSFTWSYQDNDSDPEHYSGGAVFITATNIHYHCSESWISEMKRVSKLESAGY